MNYNDRLRDYQAKRSGYTTLHDPGCLAEEDSKSFLCTCTLEADMLNDSTMRHGEEVRVPLPKYLQDPARLIKEAIGRGLLQPTQDYKY